MGKKSKRCSNKKKRILWYGFTLISLGAKSIAAIALFAITLKLSPLQTEARLFNNCVEESLTSGKSISNAVNFCKGGGN